MPADQRVSSVHLLTAANPHVQQTAWQTCLDEARLAIGITVFMDDSREEVERRATQIRARVPLVFRDAPAVDKILGLERTTQRALAAGYLTEEVARRWLDRLSTRPFLAAVTLCIVVAGS